MKIKRIIAVFITAIILTAFTGCRVGESNFYVSFGSPDSHAMMIGNMKCPQNEAAMYLASVSDYFGSIGGIDIQKTGSGEEEWFKTAAIALLSRVYSLNVYANDNDEELSEEDKESCATAAAIFSAMMSPDEMRKLNVTEEEIAEFYERYALALKVYRFITEQADSEVSEDEARVMDGYILYLTDPEKADEVDARIAAGDDFATLVQVYSEGDKRVVSFSRDDLPEAVEEAAFFLDDGVASGRVETDDGIYYVKCINKSNSELSEANRRAIIEQRQKSLINAIIDEQTEKYYSFLNEEFFGSVSAIDIEISSGKEFFKTIEAHL